jgi:hypothetical protein
LGTRRVDGIVSSICTTIEAIAIEVNSMIADPKFSYLTPAEYLVWEEEQPLKYGYMDGEVYAMTGGTISPIT